MNFRKFWFVSGLILILTYMNLLSGCSNPAPVADTGGIQFNVLDMHNNPLGGAKVVSELQPEGQLKVTGITSQNGEGVTFTNLKPGKYEFYISRFDYQQIAVIIDVIAGATPAVNLNLVALSAITPSPSPAG